MALLFSQTASEAGPRKNFQAIPLTDLTLEVVESPRHGAPMTLVRGGEERDFAAIVAMGRARAEQFRFHLDRDIDLVRYAITKQRLLAGLGSPDAREPSERHPTFRAWLPPRFLPPQVTIASGMPSTEAITMRTLNSKPIVPRLSGDDVLFWRSDLF